MAAYRCLSENSLSYKLFSLVGDDNFNYISKKEDLEILAETYIAKLSAIIARCIWQKDSFNLQFVDEIPASPSHLEGITCFGDNIEDEWFIVYLLFQLTEKDRNLIVQVQDNDGDFLLIEAADSIPNWLNPETSENRVFIYQGNIHIIPKAQSPGEITPIPSGTPDLRSALAAVKQFSSITKASSSVQSAIRSRIQGYPHKIDELKHRAHCYVPASVAAILKEDTQLLPYAVNAFCQRDPLDMKACRAMRYFAPETRVLTEVVFTRCLYAQLLSQHYEPDRIIGWNLPSKNSPHFKAHDLGMKLACGFEILASNADKSISVDEEGLCDRDFNNDVRWKRFSKSLKEKGYFRGELDGSKLHQHLMVQAKDFYLTSLKNDFNKNQDPGARVRKHLEVLSVNYDELKDSERLLKPPDDDSWMELTPETLDALLSQASQKHHAESQLTETITKGLKSFVHHKSDIDGVEPPGRNSKSKKQKVSFDPDAFADAVNTILDFRVPGSDDECSSSSMSSYSDEDDDSEIALGEEKRHSESENKKEKPGDILRDMKTYMDQMDRELSTTNVGLSFERLPKEGKQDLPKVSDNIDNEEDDDFRPVDIDLTALKNILESYSSQQGLPGPAGNLFASMGMHLPHDLDS